MPFEGLHRALVLRVSARVRNIPEFLLFLTSSFTNKAGMARRVAMDRTSAAHNKMASPSNHNSLDADSAHDEHATNLHAFHTTHGTADASASFLDGR